MMTYQHSLVTLLETIRKDRHITIEDFIEDITSVRSYYRYLSMDNEMPLDVLLRLSAKLDLNINELISFVQQKQYDENHFIQAIRYQRLKRFELRDRYLRLIHTHSLSSSYLSLYNNLVNNEGVFNSLSVLVNRDINHPLYAEYMIEQGYISISTHSVESLKKSIEFLKQYQTNHRDYYINYPLSLFKVHIKYLTNDSIDETDVINHISAHAFYDGGTSFKDYLNILNATYYTKIDDIYLKIINKHFG